VSDDLVLWHRHERADGLVEFVPVPILETERATLAPSALWGLVLRRTDAAVKTANNREEMGLRPFQEPEQ
jgi:hypothetical protein